jgi:hypothetical protein
MNFCKDCKHASKTLVFFGEFRKCRAPQNKGEPEAVNGGAKWRAEYCSTHRQFDTPDLCNPEARWFEPKK